MSKTKVVLSLALIGLIALTTSCSSLQNIMSQATSAFSGPAPKEVKPCNCIYPSVKLMND